MKKLFTLFFKDAPSVFKHWRVMILVLFSFNNVWSQLTVNQFSGTGACPTQGNTFSSVTNASVAPMSRNTINCTSTGDVFNSTNLNVTAARNNSSYIEFSITANSGFVLNLTSLSFFRQATPSAPNSLIASYSTNAANFDATRVDMATSTTPSPTGLVLTWTFPTTITTGNGGTVTFRFYPFGTTRGDGGSPALSGGNFRLDDVSLFGTVTTVAPVELTKFEAKSNQNKVYLNWATATELNNDHFEIQHSDNGEDFKPIGQLKGNGTTPIGAVYNFVHLTPSVGINYYRLKQVDVDGKYEYSPIRSVLFGKSKISVSPTFAKENITIYVSDDQSTSFGIFNLSGQQVLSGKAIGQQRIDVGFLQTGMYFIRTEFGDVIRFIKE